MHYACDKEITQITAECGTYDSSSLQSTGSSIHQAWNVQLAVHNRAAPAAAEAKRRLQTLRRHWGAVCQAPSPLDLSPFFLKTDDGIFYVLRWHGGKVSKKSCAVAGIPGGAPAVGEPACRAVWAPPGACRPPQCPRKSALFSSSSHLGLPFSSSAVVQRECLQ